MYTEVSFVNDLKIKNVYYPHSNKFYISLTDAFKHHIERATQTHEQLFLIIFNYNARYLYF